jgi:hypothetical protein
VIETAAGARIAVPAGAVPLTSDGQIGTMVFSVERTQPGTVNNPPASMTVVGNSYQFGPEGFTFAMPVEVSVPVEGDFQAGELVLARVDPTTHVPHLMNAVYDSAQHVVRAQTYELSVWQVYRFAEGASAQYYGRIDLANSHTDGTWVNACVVSYTLEYESDAANFNGSWAAAAPVGEIGWNSTVAWYLPQGTYSICVSSYNRLHPEQTEYVVLDNVLIADPWTSEYPVTVPIAAGPSFFVNGTPGSCSCTPEQTPSSGTGDIQVTLTWHSAASLDLDLWVTDPAGERCYYGNPNSTSGGHLDRDNYCGNYVNGQPENIYWLTDPPQGEYLVECDRYSDCGNTLSSQAYNVRTVVQGTTHTYSGSINTNATVEVARFSVSHDGPNFMPPSQPPRYVLNKLIK